MPGKIVDDFEGVEEFDVVDDMEIVDDARPRLTAITAKPRPPREVPVVRAADGNDDRPTRRRRLANDYDDDDDFDDGTDRGRRRRRPGYAPSHATPMGP